MLFATHTMSDVLVLQDKDLKAEDKFYGASGGKSVNYCSPNDVAAAAVRVLADHKRHKRKGYSLTGAAPVTDTSVMAESLSKALYKKVVYVEIRPRSRR
jgi:uncharacterized protein YbjT (DUF2867 family)